jgi:hypothetical protein
MKTIKVIHLPSSTGNSAYFLSNSERKIIKSDVLLLVKHNRVKSLINNELADYYLIWKNKFHGFLKILLFYLINIGRYDIFHFNSGQTLLSSNIALIDFLELPILKALGKKVVFTYQGGTGRIKNTFIKNNPELNLIHILPLFESEQDDKIKLRRIKKVIKYADLIYVTNPDLLINFNGYAIFRPYTKLIINKQTKKKIFNEILRIGHAPSTMRRKGTDAVLRAIDELKREGIEFEFILLHGLRNNDLINELKNIDLMIDQLIVGWYGGLAVECWNVGLPVMTYISPTSERLIPKEMAEEIPVLKTTYYTLSDDLKKVLNNPEILTDYSIKSIDYLIKYHDNDQIANKMIKDYKSMF